MEGLYAQPGRVSTTGAASPTVPQTLSSKDLYQKYPGSREWHYDDVPVCQTKPHDEYCPNGRCASSQIPHFRQVLADADETKGRPQFAIFVLTHLVGDVHQPLHAGDNDDRGGNEIKVKLPNGKKVNLHSAWDTSFVEGQYAGKNEVTVAKGLKTKFAAQANAWQTADVDTWIAESNKLAKTVAYGALPGLACGSPAGPARIPLPSSYVVEAERVVEEQLAKGGYRLAALLNLVLGE